MSESTLQELPTTVDEPGGRLETDAELLQQFVESRDEAAFAELVRRHGPTVLGVCRRVLDNPADADDAFQMTFLVLARRSAEILQPELLGNWLFGVAYQTASKARRTRRRRESMRTSAPPADSPQPDKVALLRELQSVVDEELHELPERYRTLLILAFYEELTHEQIAARLGWPPGSVSRRMSKARELLRNRLKKRGLTLTAGLLMVMLHQLELNAAVPTELAGSTSALAATLPHDDLLGETVAQGAASSQLFGVLRMWLSGFLLALLTLGIMGVIGNSTSTGKADAEPQEAPVEPVEPPHAMCPGSR